MKTKKIEIEAKVINPDYEALKKYESILEFYVKNHYLRQQDNSWFNDNIELLERVTGEKSLPNCQPCAHNLILKAYNWLQKQEQ